MKKLSLLKLNDSKNLQPDELKRIKGGSCSSWLCQCHNMKIIVLLIVLFLSIPVYGQNVPIMQKSASGDEIHIDFYSAYKNRTPILLTSQIADDIEFIPLETTEDCLIGNFIRNIVVTQKDIIVFDYDGCYHFNRQGKFLNKIGAKGNGPGEYTQPMSIVVDTLNHWVYFSDYHSGRFVKYDYSGRYLADLKVERMGHNNTLHKPQEIIIEKVFYQFAKKGERFCMMYYSEKQKKIISKMSCDYDKDIPGLAMCNPISYSHNGNMYLKDFWCDTIYQMIDPFHLKSYAVFDKGNFEERTRNDESLITGKESSRDRMVLDIGRISETDRYILISSNRAVMAHDKKLQKTFAGGYSGEDDKLGVQDDLYGCPGIRSDHYPSCVNGNELYTFRHAHEFIENGDGKHSITDTRYDAYRKMVDNLDEEDNPVIMIVKIKR